MGLLKGLAASLVCSSNNVIRQQNGLQNKRLQADRYARGSSKTKRMSATYVRPMNSHHPGTECRASPSRP